MNVEIECARNSYYDSVTPSDRENREKEDSIVCRICMESAEGELLSPCRCSGSMKYVHEECLKAWVLSQDEDLEQAKCELCRTEFKTELTISTKITCVQTCELGVMHCVLTPLLLSVLSMLLIIIYLLGERFIDSESSEERGYTGGLMVSCILGVIVVLIFTVKSFRESCVRYQVQNWRIVSQELEEAPKEEIEDAPADQTMANHTIDSSVIAIPNKVKYRGRRLLRPTIAPSSLVPMYNNGIVVGFQTRCETWKSTLTRTELSHSLPNQNRHGEFTPVLSRSSVFPLNRE